MPGAVHRFQRVQKRQETKPTDLVFGRVRRGHVIDTRAVNVRKGQAPEPMRKAQRKEAAEAD